MKLSDIHHSVRYWTMLSQTSSKDERKIQNGIKLFNQNPEKVRDLEIIVANYENNHLSVLQGISFLTEQGMLSGSPEDIYLFFQNNHVSGQKLGQYLGQRENLKILELFVADFNFDGCSVDEALRSLLNDIVLPGDMDQMDQILSSFADAHHRANPRASSSPDAVYALAFTVVLLSLSLHSAASAHARITPEVSPRS